MSSCSQRPVSPALGNSGFLGGSMLRLHYGHVFSPLLLVSEELHTRPFSVQGRKTLEAPLLASSVSNILGSELIRNPAFRGLSVLVQINKTILPVTCGYQPLGHSFLPPEGKEVKGPKLPT